MKSQTVPFRHKISWDYSLCNVGLKFSVFYVPKILISSVQISNWVEKYCTQLRFTAHVRANNRFSTILRWKWRWELVWDNVCWSTLVILRVPFQYLLEDLLSNWPLHHVMRGSSDQAWPFSSWSIAHESSGLNWELILWKRRLIMRWYSIYSNTLNYNFTSVMVYFRTR